MNTVAEQLRSANRDAMMTTEADVIASGKVWVFAGPLVVYCGTNRGLMDIPKTGAPVEYDALGRMKYHPDFHPRHKLPWMTSEEKYLIENYVTHGPEVVSLALGRTIGVIMSRAYELRRDGKMTKYEASNQRHTRTSSKRVK